MGWSCTPCTALQQRRLTRCAHEHRRSAYGRVWLLLLKSVRMLTEGVNACQAWAVLEAADGNTQLARQLFRCAVKADPSSEPSWLVRTVHKYWTQKEISTKGHSKTI